MILNVPLPESGHRFKDIVLHDGARNGTRALDGVEIPVFDALGLLAASDYKTFHVVLDVPDDAAETALRDLCDTRELGIEDWSTIRWICQECSTGNPGEHDCRNAPVEAGQKQYAIAAPDADQARALLSDWVAQFPRAKFSDLEPADEAVS